MGDPTLWASAPADGTAYERFRPRYPEALFEWTAQLVDRHERACDCGAGSGQASAGLASRFRRTIATDHNSHQLRSAPATASVHRVICDTQHVPIRTASIDLIAVGQALHWFATEAFFAEVRRVGREGSAFVAWTYGLLRITPAIDAVIRDFHTNVVGPHWAPGRAHVDQGYRSIALPFTEITTPPMTITAQWSLDHVLGYVRTWSAVRRAREATGRDPVDQLAHTLAPIWGPRSTPRALEWPLTIRAARIHP